MSSFIFYPRKNKLYFYFFELSGFRRYLLLLLGLMLSLLLWFFLVYGPFNNYIAQNNHERDLKLLMINRHKEITNSLANVKKNLILLKKLYKGYQKRVYVDKSLEDIFNLISHSNLRLKNYNTGIKNKKSLFMRRPITLELEGDFFSLKNLIQKILELNELAFLDTLIISLGVGNKRIGKITIDLLQVQNEKK